MAGRSIAGRRTGVCLALRDLLPIVLSVLTNDGKPRNILAPSCWYEIATLQWLPDVLGVLIFVRFKAEQPVFAYRQLKPSAV